MQLSWDPIYASPTLVISLVVVMFGLLVLIRPEHETLPVARRRWLLGLRFVAGLVLLLAMLRPSLVKTDDRPAPATLAVLLDGSRSMMLPAGNGQPRWAVQADVWERLRPALKNSDELLDVQVLTYDESARPIDLSGVSAWLEEPADGQETDLAAGLRGAVSRAAGRPLAGVVMAGDGTQTARVEGAGAQQVARTLSSLEVPLWSIPIGPRGGDDTRRDVEVDGVPDSFRVFSGNTFTVNATVRTQSLVGADVPVRVKLIPQSTGSAAPAAADEARELAIRSVVPRSQSDSQNVELSLTAPPPGRYRLEIVADEQPGEALTINNRQIAFLEVRAGGGRILYLEGEPREEQLRLRRSLGRFPDLELVYLWIRRDTVGRWPVDLESSLEKNRFDIYILGDLHADALGEKQLQMLRDRVGEGAGLLMLGGLNTYGRGGYADSPLADVLPIRMKPSIARSPQAPADQEGRLEGPLPLRVAKPHPILKLDAAASPQAVFDRLRPLLGANRFADLKPVPGVEVLLETEAQDPLLVIGEFGSGRVAAFAGDSTWQWWRQGASPTHRRFWRQVMLWLLARDSLSDDAIAVELDTRRFAASDPPEFRVRLRQSDTSQPPPPLAAEVIAEDNSVIPLTASPRPTGAGETVVVGQLPDLPPGLYRLRGFSPNSTAGTPLPPDELAFQVIESDRELLRPLADPAFMEQLSALTADAGGRAFSPDQVDELIDTIRTRRQAAVSPVTEKRRLGDDPLSGWLMFVTFAGLLVSEWALRKRWGLA